MKNFLPTAGAGVGLLLVAGAAQASLIPGVAFRDVRVKLGSAQTIMKSTSAQGLWDEQAVQLVSVDAATATQETIIEGVNVSGDMTASAQVFSVSPRGTAETSLSYAFSLLEPTMFTMSASSGAATPGYEPTLQLIGPLGVLLDWELDPGDPRMINATLLPGSYSIEAYVGGEVQRPGSFFSSLSFALALNTSVVPSPGTGVAMMGVGLLALRRRRA